MQYEITNTDWTQISSAGKNVTARIDEQGDGWVGHCDIRIACSIAKPALTDDILSQSKRLYSPIGNIDSMVLSARGERYSFWARAANVGDVANVITEEYGIGAPLAMDVSIQDATNLIVSSEFAMPVAIGTTASIATVNTNTVTLTAGHGFVNGTAGQVLAIPGYYLSEVKSVSGDVITVEMPFSYTFPAGTAIERGSKLMGIDGSVTPKTFLFRANAGRTFDITGFKLTVLSAINLAMDDSLFANITALTNGIVFRIKKPDTQYNNVFNVQSNQDLKMYGTLQYSDKAPAGKYGMDFICSFKDIYGVVARIYGDLSQQIELIVRDNLSTLEKVTATVTGHVVE